jgi:alkylresorcinol/alkylpyrone synthase
MTVIGTQQHSEARMPRLVSLGTSLPPHTVRQSDVRTLAVRIFSGLSDEERRLLGVFDHAGIETRHVAMPLAWYEDDHSFGETNALYIETALALASDACTKALSKVHLTPADVDHLVVVSSTGVCTPSLDARLANVLRFREDFCRTPIWGLGCAGGVAGLARARDFALAHPRARVLLLALELCSLTFQRGELDRRNLVAASLFSDGAAAALVVGAEAEPTQPAGRPALALVDARSTLWPETLDVMGWNVDERGLHVVFSRDIPTIVRNWVRPNVESFLRAHDLSLESLSHVVTHPGGPKVLAAYAEALGLREGTLRHAVDVLRECGNMSSPTCLFVLERFLDAGEIGEGEPALLAALGPGFSSEYVLARGVTSPRGASEVART